MPFETTACPLCDSNDSRVLLTAGDLLYEQPGEFRLVCCVNCRHVYLNPRPTPECIGQFYPRHYGPFRLDDATFGEPATRTRRGRLSQCLRAVPGFRRSVEWLLESRAEYIPRVAAPTKRALEIGCADGSFLERLHAAGWNVEGVEPSALAADRARSRGLKVHVGTLESIAFPEAHFDAVFAYMVIEHLHEPKRTLAQVRRILKPSGWLVLSVPNFACWERRCFGRYWYALQLPTHLQHFTPASLRRLLDATGFQVEKLVHQRNVNNLVGTLALWWRARFPQSRFPDKLLRFIDNPSALGLLPLVPLANLLAWARQAGRLTVIARPKPSCGTTPDC